eukprot:scaffold72309_cov32-Prasinocladus_malaysianus.AAC.2
MQGGRTWQWQGSTRHCRTGSNRQLDHMMSNMERSDGDLDTMIPHSDNKTGASFGTIIRRDEEN